MNREILREYGKGFKNFIKKEPLYLWLLIFIVVVNLAVMIEDVSEKIASKGLAKEQPTAGETVMDGDILKEAVAKNEKAFSAATSAGIGIVLFVLIGLFLDFFILMQKSSGREVLPRSTLARRPGWSVWDALKVAILFIFFGYVLVIMEALFSTIFPFLKEQGGIVAIANTTVMDALGVVVVFYFAITCYKHKIEDLGLTLKNFFKNITYGVLGYISVIPVLIATVLVTLVFVDLFKYKPPPQPVLELFMGEERPQALIYMSLFVAIAGPVMEEIFFRGFLYNALKKDLGVTWSILVSGVLFSLLHAHLVGFLPILILGIFLAYLYEKTGSLVPSITVHIIHNLIMVYFVFLIKDFV